MDHALALGLMFRHRVHGRFAASASKSTFSQRHQAQAEQIRWLAGDGQLASVACWQTGRFLVMCSTVSWTAFVVVIIIKELVGGKTECNAHAGSNNRESPYQLCCAT